jgi:hypothetical protein
LPAQDRRDQSAAAKSRKSRASCVNIRDTAYVPQSFETSLSKGRDVFEETSQMALMRGNFVGYEFDRMVVLFSMIDGEKEIQCAVSTSAMDDLEKLERIKPDQREAQFLRLRDQIEERAACKFLAMEFEGNPRGIILRSIDFRK